jgi:hypothetical protein
MISIKILNAKMKMDISISKKWVMVRAIPVVPPVIKSAGNRNSLMAREKIALPNITVKIDEMSVLLRVIHVSVNR